MNTTFETSQNGLPAFATPEFLDDRIARAVRCFEHLTMMLHVCSIGMGDPECQKWVSRAVETYPNIKIILAHMGRYFHPSQFFEFFKTDVFDHPNLFLETSDAMVTEIYAQMLTRPDWCKRLIFGSDLPYGFFSCEDRNDCDNPSAAYNTYHVIGALKTAFDRSGIAAEKQQKMKEDIFLNNARERLLALS